MVCSLVLSFLGGMTYRSNMEGLPLGECVAYTKAQEEQAVLRNMANENWAEYCKKAKHKCRIK